MTDELNFSDLERRLTQSLHRSALRPQAGLIDRCLAQTAVTQQRHVFLALGFAPVLAGAAVVVVAVAVGLAIGTLLPRDRNVGPAPTVSPTPTAAPSAAETGPASRTPEASPDARRCTNPELGFIVEVPSGWWANERVEAEPPLTPIEGCTYFAEEPVELVPNAQLPPGIAISAGLDQRPPRVSEPSTRVLSSEETEVAGLPATVEEIEWTEDTAFESAGDRAYAYRITLASGEILRFGTLNQPPSEQYEARKAVLDAMMETLELSDG